LSNAETDSWSAPLTIVMFIGSGLLLIAFAVIEARSAAPLLPLQIVLDRNRVGAYLAIMVAFCSMFSAFLFLTYYAQQNLGYSPLKTGVAFLPLAGGVAAAAGVANARLIPKLGTRRVVPPGMLIAAAGMFWLAHLDIHSTYAGNVLGPLLVLGVGMGLTFTPAIATATAGIADADAGVASAMVNTSQQIGGAIGTAALSTIFASALTRYMTSHQRPSPALRPAAAIHGYTVAFGVSCGLFLAGAVVTALLLRGTPSGDDGHSDRVTASHRRLRNPIGLGTKLFVIALGITLVATAIMAATLHGSRPYDEVVRSCLGTKKPQDEHYRPGALNQLTNARDCGSVVGR
jgi:MFS transporter